MNTGDRAAKYTAMCSDLEEQNVTVLIVKNRRDNPFEESILHSLHFAPCK